SSAPPDTLRHRASRETNRRSVPGDCGPGMPPSESKPAQLLHTSRTPVREALSRLIEERYVERVAGRGYSVAPITVELIQNLFEVRRLLEGAAAARAAERADAALVRRLRAVTAFEYRSEDAASFKSATDANAEFHLEVCRASGNALFLDLVRHCLDQVTRLIALGVDY